MTALLDHRGARPRRRIRRTLGTLSATSVGHDVVPPSGRRRGGEVSCVVSSNKRCDSSESPSGIRDIGGTAGHQVQLLLVLHPKTKESVGIYSGVGQRQASHQLRQVLVSQQETTAEKTRRVYAAVTTRSLAERLVYQHFAPFSSCWLRFFGGRFRNFGVVLSGGQSSPKAAANEDEPTRFELIRCSIAGVKKGWVDRGECKAQKRDGGGCNDLATPRVKLQRLNSALIITLCYSRRANIGAYSHHNPARQHPLPLPASHFTSSGSVATRSATGSRRVQPRDSYEGFANGLSINESRGAHFVPGLKAQGDCLEYYFH